MTHPTDKELDTLVKRFIERVKEDCDEAWKVAHASTDRGMKAEARADRAEAALAAQIEADDIPPFHFDRYINGVLMAEGVEINKETTLDSAMKVASRIASKGPNGEAPVLVYRNQPRDRTALDRMLADAKANALRRAAAVCVEYPVPIGCTKSAIELQSAILAMIPKEGEA